MGSCTVTVHAIMIQFLVASGMLGMFLGEGDLPIRTHIARVPGNVAHVPMPNFPYLLLDRYSVK
jgi:hypothetical protein